MQRTIARQKHSLAMRDGAVWSLGIIGAGDLSRPQVHSNQAQKGGVRIIVELGINQVRELARPAVDLDQVRSFYFAQEGPVAALVNAQERFEGVEGTAVDVKVVRQEFAHGRAPASLVD